MEFISMKGTLPLPIDSGWLNQSLLGIYICPVQQICRQECKVGFSALKEQIIV